MFNITNHLGNESQNHREISAHSTQSGYYWEERTAKFDKDVEKKEPLNTVGENVFSYALFPITQIYV